MCMSPATNTEGKVKLKVTLTGKFDDTQEIDFEYYVDPKLISLKPNIGRKSGGTIVQIYGKGFKNYTDTLKCAFGTIYVEAKFVSPDQITCQYDINLQILR